MELYKPDINLKRAFICDIDGTLCNHTDNRGHYEYSKCLTDTPNWPIIHLVQTLEEDWYPIFVTGRMEVENDTDIRDLTNQWITAYVTLQDYDLHMRKEGDFRKDSIIKKEIFDNHIRDNYCVEFAIDDRNQVVDMWRQMGLTCLQVDYGDF